VKILKAVTHKEENGTPYVMDEDTCA
jgi:hypothetical protein